MAEPSYIGLAVLQLSKIFKFETYCDKLKPYFGQEKIQLHCMGCDSFVMTDKAQNINND